MWDLGWCWGRTDTTPDDIRPHFERFGDITDVYIPKDHYTGQSRGFAFVRYSERRDAEDAVDAMDGKEVNGREVSVQFARFGRSDGPPRGRGGPRGGGRDRYHDRDYDDRRGGRPIAC